MRSCDKSNTCFYLQKTHGCQTRQVDDFSERLPSLKVQLCKLYNHKNIIASTQIANTEILAFIADLFFKFCL